MFAKHKKIKITGIIILAIAMLFVLQDIFLAPPDKKFLFRPESIQTALPAQNQNDATSAKPADHGMDFPADVTSCGAKKDIFSVSPIKPSSISYIEPLGHVNPTGHVFPINHLYMYLPLDDQRTALKTDVFSPGDITVFKIERFRYFSDQSRKNLLRTDYTLSFSPCSDISGFFYHLTSLSDKLLNSFVSPFDYCNNVTAGDEIFESCGKSVDIKLSAGEKIGTAGGEQRGSQALDWVLEDFGAKPLEYANDSRFSPITGQNYSRQIVCPLDYFTSGLRNSLYRLLGGYPIDNPFTAISKRTAAPLCGTTAQDVSGTAQGNWFAEKTPSSNFSEDPNLALVHDDVDTKIGVFSMGTSMSSKGLEGGAYYFTPLHLGSVNRDFDEVKADGNVYCYDVNKKLYSNVDAAPPRSAVILQLISPDEINVERLNADACGSGPWKFSSASQIYYR